MRRRRTARSGIGVRRYPPWALLLFGLALGITAVLLTQLVLNRWGSPDGLAGLFRSSAKSVAERPVEPKKRPEAVQAPAPKPKLDFYTVLPEMETVLPERGARAKTTKSEKPEEGVRYVLQAGSFASFSDADQLKARLALQGMVAHIQKVAIEGKGEYHRVRLGPYTRLEQLDQTDQQLRGLGLKPIRLKLKPEAG